MCSARFGTSARRRRPSRFSTSASSQSTGSSCGHAGQPDQPKRRARRRQLPTGLGAGFAVRGRRRPAAPGSCARRIRRWRACRSPGRGGASYSSCRTRGWGPRRRWRGEKGASRRKRLRHRVETQGGERVRGGVQRETSRAPPHPSSLSSALHSDTPSHGVPLNSRGSARRALSAAAAPRASTISSCQREARGSTLSVRPRRHPHRIPRSNGDAYRSPLQRRGCAMGRGSEWERRARRASI